jgi:GNAT superfamily N-acetyltransferase
MEIRKAKIEDLEEITELLIQVKKLHENGRSDIFKPTMKSQAEEETIEILSGKRFQTIIATNEEDKAIGMAIYEVKERKGHKNLKDARTLWVEDIVVEEKQQGKRIGTRLMEELQKIAKKKKCIRIELNVWNFNTKAYEFYQKLGMNEQRTIMEFSMQ